jgi:C1A family cysteine protease
VLEHHRRALGHREDLSEQFLYHETKRIDGAPGSCGTWQVKALQVLSTLGACREQVWGYNSTPPCNQNGFPPAAARPDAAERKCAPVVLGPHDVQGARSLLASGRILGVSIPVYASWANSAAVRLTGRVTMRLAGEPVIGGHAVCLVGYQDDAGHPGGGYFILRNSWGRQWAAGSAYGPGYGTIPYAYVGRDGWELVSVA